VPPIAPGGAVVRGGRAEGARDPSAGRGGRAARTNCGRKGGGIARSGRGEAHLVRVGKDGMEYVSDSNGNVATRMANFELRKTIK
jgi:hypothetical protein